MRNTAKDKKTYIIICVCFSVLSILAITRNKQFLLLFAIILSLVFISISPHCEKSEVLWTSVFGIVIFLPVNIKAIYRLMATGRVIPQNPKWFTFVAGICIVSCLLQVELIAICYIANRIWKKQKRLSFMSNLGTFTMVDEHNKMCFYEVILRIDSSEPGEEYLVYTDNTVDEHGRKNVYASIYNPTRTGDYLGAIEDDLVWERIEEKLDNC